MAMDETLKKLDEMGPKALDELQSWISTTKDFVTEQAPLVVQEIINWGMAQHVVWMIIFAFPVTVGIFGLRKRAKVDWTAHSDITAEQAWCTIKLIIGGIGFIGFFVNVYWFCYVFFAPRLYVLDYLRDLIKTTGN